MTTAHLPGVQPPTCSNVSQGTEILSTVPLRQAQGMVYPTMNQLPGASYPSSAFLPKVTFPDFPSFVPGFYSGGGVNYYPNYHGYGTAYTPTGFITPIEDPALPMNNAGLLAPSCIFGNMPVYTASSASDLLSLEVTGRHEQPTQTTSSPFPTQHEVALVQDYQQAQNKFPMQLQAAPTQDQRQTQDEVQDAQQDFSVERPLQELREGERKDDQTRKESHAAVLEPENTADHFCFNNQNSACLGRGAICLDFLCEFVAKHPDTLSAEQIGRCLIAALTPGGSSAGQCTAGQPLQTDTSDSIPSQHGAATRETASPSSSATASTSSSPSSYLSPLNDIETASESMSILSMGTVNSSTGMYQLSEGHGEDRLKKQRRKHRMDTGNIRNLGGIEKRCKKKKPVEGIFVCLICKILRQYSPPLSRKDALKRHVLNLHPMFRMLCLVKYWEFKILEPRKINEPEDLVPLIAFCITVQSQARECGMKIEKERDFALLYPDVAASMNHS